MLLNANTNAEPRKRSWKESVWYALMVWSKSRIIRALCFADYSVGSSAFHQVLQLRKLPEHGGGCKWYVMHSSTPVTRRKGDAIVRFANRDDGENRRRYRGCEFEISLVGKSNCAHTIKC